MPVPVEQLVEEFLRQQSAQRAAAQPIVVTPPGGPFEPSHAEVQAQGAAQQRARESQARGEAAQLERTGTSGAVEPAAEAAQTAIAREQAREALLAPSRVVERASQLSRLGPAFDASGDRPPEQGPVVRPLPRDNPELVVSRGSAPRKEGDADPDVAQLLDVVRRMGPVEKAKLREALKE